MKMPAVAIALSGLVIATTACTPSGEQQPATQETATAEAEMPHSPLVGAWRITRFFFASPDTSFTISDPQPSLMIFLTSHYSQMYVPGDEPRELFSGDEPVLGAREPTDAEVLTAYGSFIANSGTYEVSGSTIVTRPIVAKTPNVMAGGSISYRYIVEGDALWLSPNLPWAPDVEVSIGLTRLE